MTLARLSTLEERIDALETAGAWADMPPAADTTIHTRSDLWTDALPPLASYAAVLYDPMECDDEQLPGVYL